MNFKQTSDIKYTSNKQTFNTDANSFMGKRIYSTKLCRLMTHGNEGLLIAVLPVPWLTWSSWDVRRDVRRDVQVSMWPGTPMPCQCNGTSRDTWEGDRVAALADLAACTKGCWKAAESPLPVYGIHKERGGPGMLQRGF